METWNDRLAAACEESGQSNNSLAKKAGVSAPTFSAWVGAASIKPAETIGAHRLFAICRELGIRPEWVLFGELPKFQRDVWPFSVDVNAVMQLPADEIERVDDFISQTIDRWERKGKNADRPAEVTGVAGSRRLPGQHKKTG
ncbi:helix-turn-helix domain-containing protein [Cupriavidus gilardii]|uniref:helix-turn-helix domain-containing protein n=1 Tax=Cupriavidus gilardii TaxID=82541 RepID=UPI001573D55F|nr:helix-turn-helix transcriptional regulator [Cupriavidus gilardii]NSX05060.1 helix-turn-helix transcriptional regulator [Cupriavidus gilardii]